LSTPTDEVVELKNPNPPTDLDRLRELLRRNAKTLTDEAIESGGEISAGKLEELGRLARLVEVRAAEVQPHRARWPIAVLVGITLIVVSVLLFARVPETEIELDLVLSDVSFKLPRQQVLSGVIKLSTLGVSGQNEIRFPRVGTRAEQTLRASEGLGSAIRLTAVSDGKQQGTITLAPVTVPSETQFWLRPTDIPNAFRLTIKGSSLKLKVDVSGPVGVALAGMRYEELNFVSPQTIHLQAAANDVDIDLGFPSAPTKVFSPQLAATAVSLFSVTELLDDEHTIVNRVSTVVSGSIYFESLGGRELRLRSGEAISFESSQGEIRTLAMQEGQIAFAFHGKVRGMMAGMDQKRSLMPTYLEWLRARHSLSLLWGTTLYILGLIISVRGWWRSPK
jgi:hypothetical protein